MTDAELRARYTAEPVPPCRVCGRPLTPEKMGGGSPTEWACGDFIRESKRTDADYQHYRDSRWTQYQHGDPDVLALLDRTAALKAALTEMTNHHAQFSNGSCHEIEQARTLL
jgi:hypothetical protein